MLARRTRQGNYSIIIGVAMPVLVGFLALGVDTAWVQIAQSQTQDVADAAAHAALIEYRRTGSTSEAQDAAEKVVELNRIGEGNGEVTDVKFGEWNRGGDFNEGGEYTNAVQVQIARQDSNELPLYFAKIFGKDSARTDATAVSASRSLHAVLVMDITASFRYDIHFARDGAVSFLDIVHDNSSRDDKVGMTTFFSRYSHVWTEMDDIGDTVSYNAMRAQWNTLTWGHTAHPDWYGPWEPNYPMRAYGESYFNNSPQMPWYYGDDWGTDHSVGMKLGIDVLMEQAEVDPNAYRALIILTDGKPVGLTSEPVRRPLDLEEPWRMWMHGDRTRSASTIKSESDNQADRAEDNNINVWTISLGDTAQADFMATLTRGDGRSYSTSNPAELEPIFEEIAVGLPMLIVK